jgi:sulfotransferase family protein
VDAGLLTHWRPDPAQRRAAEIRREIGNANTVVLSFPKAGRSWVCYFLARYVTERTGGLLDLDVLPDGREIPPVRFVHEHIDVFEDAPAPVRLLNEELLMRRRIVVLARDPRDSLVSYWHHKRVREQRPVPTRLELFADCPVYGIERISQSTALLLDLYDNHPGDKLLITYEDLISEPARRLPQILRFSLDGRPLDEQSCRNALEASRFENMREWERGLTAEEARTRYDSRFGRRQDGALEDAHFKVRRGKVGAFRTEMSPELHRHVIGLPHTADLLGRLAGLVPRPAGARYDQLQVAAPVGRA